MFSPEDGDLAARSWRLSRNGYARWRNRKSSPPFYPTAHRMVLERMAGRALTSDELADHINGVKLDNRRENLRLVSHQGNAENRHTDFRGTTFHKQAGKWQAKVQFHRRSYYLGLFADRSEAALAAENKRKTLGFLT